MKLTFLGTGSSHGIPVIGCKCNTCKSNDKRDMRLRSALFVETAHQNIVIDVGPDFRQQMLREEIVKIDAVLITHEHKDHTAGLDDLRAYNYLMQRAINVFSEKRVLEALKREYEYIFAKNHYPGAPQILLNEVDETPFSINNDTIIPIRAYHNSLPILGFRIKNMAYLTDVKTIEEKEKNKLKNLDILILSCLREKPHVAHLGLNEALALVEELKPRQTFFTHISHKQLSYKQLIKKLNKNILPAYDGLIVKC